MNLQIKNETKVRLLLPGLTYSFYLIIDLCTDTSSSNDRLTAQNIWIASDAKILQCFRHSCFPLVQVERFGLPHILHQTMAGF